MPFTSGRAATSRLNFQLCEHVIYLPRCVNCLIVSSFPRAMQESPCSVHFFSTIQPHSEIHIQ